MTVIKLFAPLGGKRLWLPALGALSLALTACSTAPAQPEQMKLDLAIKAKDTLNPDDKGRASPVLVRLYELKTSSTFENADYYSLNAADRTVLTRDLLVRDEFILRPGEFRDIERKLDPDTQVLGLLVGYRDLGKATWRTVYKLPPAPKAAWYRAAIPARKIMLQIVLDEQAITVSKPD